jgi:nitroreductase
MDIASCEKLLTTTRSVRKRLDLQRPVDLALISRCLEIAMQAPAAANLQRWHWVVVTDPAKRAALADIYRRVFDEFRQSYGERLLQEFPEDEVRAAGLPRMFESSGHLAAHLHEVPVHVIPCVRGRVERATVFNQTSTYGSILPAAWSFMLALRAHGLGSTWTTIHVVREAEAAALLGIPDDYTQTGLIPVGYYTGSDFKPAKRYHAHQHISWDSWGGRR